MLSRIIRIDSFKLDWLVFSSIVFHDVMNRFLVTPFMSIPRATCRLWFHNSVFAVLYLTLSNKNLEAIMIYFSFMLWRSCIMCIKSLSSVTFLLVNALSVYNCVSGQSNQTEMFFTISTIIYHLSQIYVKILLIYLVLPNIIFTVSVVILKITNIHY